jgi:RND family efflux transporter MFP subunit
MQQRTNLKLYLAVSIAILLLAACGGGGTGSAAAKTPTASEAAAKVPEAVELSVGRAQIRNFARAISVTGSLLPDETVTVNSEVIGRVQTIRADFGQFVRKGDVLAQIDKQEYQIQLDRAKAALAQALARLGMSPGQELTPPSATPATRQVQARLEDAKFKYESAAKLVKSGDISQERYTEIEKAYRAQQAAADAANDEVRTQWASMESMRADVAMMEKKLADTTLRAPFDGVVSQKHISPGQYVKDNAPIVTLVKTNPLRLRVDIPETAAGQVKLGMTLEFTTDALPGQTFQAVVREANPSLESKSRSLQVEARLTKGDPRLRPGMFTQVRLVVDTAASRLMVPKQAVYSIAGLSKVFAIRDGKAVEFRVNPGEEFEGMVELPGAEIKDGEVVATSRQPALITGTPVRVAGGKS